MTPQDPPLHPNWLLIPMTQTLTPSSLPLKLGQVIQPLQSPLQTLIWTIMNPVKCSPLMNPHLSTSWTPIPPLTLSINTTSIMCLNTLLPIMGLLLIGAPMVALLDQMSEFWKGLVELSLSLAFDNHEHPGLDIVTCAALHHTNQGKVVLIMHDRILTYGTLLDVLW